MVTPEFKDFCVGLALTDVQLYEVYKRFCQELRKGLARDTNGQADTKCFNSFVTDLPTGNEDGKFMALDLGGTNFRVLCVTLKGNFEDVVDFKTYPLIPEVLVGTAEQLFDYIAECIADFVNVFKLESQLTVPLGFTFSFPCVQMGLSKALLVRWTKGFKVSGVENEDVGRLLREAIARRGNLDIEVVAILNDTVGTLMSCAHRNTECRIGLIVGTGSNACYLESTKCTEMLDPDMRKNNKYVVINIEWGAFGEHGALDFILTEYDREIDADSLNSGQQIFEKLVAGMYLGEILRLSIRKAIVAELLFFEDPARPKILEILLQKNIMLSEFVSQIDGDRPPEFPNTRSILTETFKLADVNINDIQKVRYIANLVAKRSAYLVGICLSALINKINEPRVVVGIDGSVYRFHPKYDTYLRHKMRLFVNPKLDFDIMLSDDGSGRGAALVAAVACKK